MKIVSLLAIVFCCTALAAQQNPKLMPKLGTVDQRFQSYNVKTAEVIGGRFWKPYGPPDVAAAKGASAFEQRGPINLSNPRLRKLAEALGPAYVRISGTWSNTAYFHDSDGPPLATPPPGFSGVLTRAQWKGVVDFAKAVDAKIVTSFAISEGTRDTSGAWTPNEAHKFLDFTRSVGGSIAAGEFMNGPTFIDVGGLPKGYDAAAYGRDFALFHPFIWKEAPAVILLGPSAVAEGTDSPSTKLLPAKELLEVSQEDTLDVFSYHFYGAASERCRAMLGEKALTSAEAALTEDWLSRTSVIEAFYAGLRDQFAPGKPMWVTESGQAACGGDRWASTFLDSFHYVDELGRLAQQHVQVIMHNTLAASDYGLIDDVTLTQRPNYWAALLWHRTMGTAVLDPGKAESPLVHLYAHCTKDHAGGVTIHALNLSTSASQSIYVPQRSVRFALTAPELTSRTAQLNDRVLKLTDKNEIPTLSSIPTSAGVVELPAASITFLTLNEASNLTCW